MAAWAVLLREQNHHVGKSGSGQGKPLPPTQLAVRRQYLQEEPALAVQDLQVVRNHSIFPDGTNYAQFQFRGLFSLPV
ncbi:hypothetical protein [Marinobacter sp. NFXS9]|uniref:hypothetical protein n=1 Tax=Marinobacter sp. NFXS9 TaxID=2818433 RepID=UPI0032DE70FB